MADAMHIFDRAAVRRHRDRAAAGFRGHDFLFAEIAARLVERLGDVRRQFTRALDLACHDGVMARALAGRDDISLLVSCDPSHAMVRRAPAPAVVAEEAALPFADGAFDLAVSVLGLHWVNDLPGALVQLRRALRPDGLLLAAMLGGNTLWQLRQMLLEAEADIEGGASPRVSPFADVRDAGGLLQRAGFALPVVDSDSITVTWPDPLALMRELRDMGEANAVAGRRRGLSRRETLMNAAARYRERFGDEKGRVPATFEILYLTAWAPDASQQKPLAPGSAAQRLADALDTEERPAGERAGRG